MHHPKSTYNEEMLHKTVTEDNPLAVIKCKDETSSNNNKTMSKDLNTIYDTRNTMLCRAAIVDLSKMNIESKWGSFNGAIGNIIDIIFQEWGKSKQ